MNKSERAIHETQQRHLHDVRDKRPTPRCGREHIERDTERRELRRVTSRPHRIVYEIPRKHTLNGYAYDA
jgi:hypothetical protein